MKNNYLHTGNTTKKSSARARPIFRAFGVVAAFTLAGLALAAGPEHQSVRSSKSQIVAENSQARSGKNPIAEKYNTLVMRVYFRDRDERDRLAQELSAEEVPTTGGYLTVIRDRDLYYNLTARGLHVEIDENNSRKLSDPQIMHDTFYGGYKSVEEIYAFLDEKVAAVPRSGREDRHRRLLVQGQSRLVRPTQSLERLRPVCATHHEPQHTRPQTGLLGGRRYTRPRDRYARSRHAHD